MPCCDTIEPHHTAEESTIVFDTAFFGPAHRLALTKDSGPSVCSEEDYYAVFQKADGDAISYMKTCPWYCQWNFFGNPCHRHGIDVAGIQKNLNDSFPHLSITVEDKFVGWFDAGHWEFVITIRAKNNTGTSAPVKNEIENE